MVASAHPYATVAGLDVLRAGGTAADAAIATNAVLAVTQPNMCGVGGDLFVLYYEAATRRVHFLNGAGRSGSRASLAELKRRGAAALPGAGFRGPEDLAGPGGGWGEPIATTYRGFRVYETPPPTQGLAALIALNILERFPLARRPLHSVQHLHLLLEVVKLAYADRDRWIGDPAQARVPLAELLDKTYAARRGKAFDARKAQAYAAGDPEGDTSRFVVADGHGNVASVIQSLFNSFGSGIVVPGCGVLLQNRGRHFQLEPAHPSVLAPPKRPFHTLVASIVTRDERPVHALSTMGGNGQAMFHVQILTNLLDYGFDPQEAIERPRFLIGAFLPGEPTETIHLESRLPRAVVAGLVRKGHPIKPAPEFFTRTGHAHAISFRDGTMLGGADPRGDGVALGF